MNKTDSPNCPFSSGHIDRDILDAFCNHDIAIDYIFNPSLLPDLLKALELHNPELLWSSGMPPSERIPTGNTHTVLHNGISFNTLYCDMRAYIKETYPNVQIVPIADIFTPIDSPDINQILELLP